MKVLSKQKDTIEILAFPSEITVDKGQYIMIKEAGKAMLCQVVDVNYVDIPGILEDMLREASLEMTNHEEVFDPFNIGSISILIRETRLVKAKIRCIIENNSINFSSSWLPSRFKSRISEADVDMLMSSMKMKGKRKIALGEVYGKEFWVDAESFDGRLTIITGKKETGKSHIAKLISTGLVEHGATVLVFDINCEYVNLCKNLDGSKSKLAGKHIVLEPGVNFVVAIEDAGLRTFLDILIHVYDTPSNSCREFCKLWDAVKRNRGRVTMKYLREAAQRVEMHDSIREAILTRLMAIEATGFFVDGVPSTLDVRGVVGGRRGRIVVVSLRDLLPTTGRMVVEFLLSKLTDLLHAGSIPPLFLVAEEAHLYLKDTYWDDIVTRMRHLGLSPIFVTNQPDSIPEAIYRQADNVVLFNFTNEADLEAISKTSRIDSESVKMIVPYLPPRHCMLIGYLVKDIPVVLKVMSTELVTMGKTRTFFEYADNSYSGTLKTCLEG